MNIKKVVSFDQGVVWKIDHSSNPYAIVLKALKIWRFTETENQKSYKFFTTIIKDNAVDFKWGLQKQKTIKVFYHDEYCYFNAPPDIIYRVIIKKEDKKKTKKKKNNKGDIYV